MGMSGDTALALAKSYVKKTLQGQGALKGQDGFSPTITENADNTDKIYKLDITTANSAFTTPNLKGADGQGGTGGSGEENTIESISVNGTPISVDKNKNVDITVPSIDGLTKDADLATVAKSGDYEDLSNKPTIPDAYDDTALSNRVKSVEDEVPNLATKTYVGEQITNAEHLKREIVTVLPSDTEASDNIIYMLKVESATGNDKYQEYMKIDGTVQMVGDTSVDLTDYAKSAEIPTTVAELTDSADYTKKTELEKYSNTEEMNNAIEQSAKDVKQEIEDNYATKDELNRKTAKVYSFHINGNESNPSDAVTYLDDAVGMTPVYMDFANNKFNYGSWGNAFFMPNPCMLKYDGTLDYYLDKNDYSKKIDGTASDVADMSYDGNAMIEWGAGGKIWYKIIPDSNDQSSATISFANAQIDSDYVDWSFHNYNGKIVDRFYTPIYNGSTDGTRLRSMSGQVCIQSKTAQQEVDLAKANNVDGNSVWNTEILSDIQLVNLLLVLIGKSLDTQSVFGRGHDIGHVNDSSQNYGMLNSGTMDTKGMFWGSNDGTSGVKVFGMENWWGNQWRRYAGDINDNGVHKVKYTYGTEDGSTEVGFNTTGQGYKVINEALPSVSGSYIQKMKFEENEISPLTASGTSSTYYCDGLWTNNAQVNYALRGGDCSYGVFFGALCLSLINSPADAGWYNGASISCKPLA